MRDILNLAEINNLAAYNSRLRGYDIITCTGNIAYCQGCIYLAILKGECMLFKEVMENCPQEFLI